MKSKGAVLIANNNFYLDYVKQAVYAAKSIKKHLDIPVTIITNSQNYLDDNFDASLFDKVIFVEDNKDDSNKNQRIIFDGEYSQKTVFWKNTNRNMAYSLSPYDETLLVDTDFIVNNNSLKNIFDSNNDFMLYKNSYEIANFRNTEEFENVSDTGIDFYWATVVFFRKTPLNEIFFDLIEHIKEEWDYYVRIYRLPSNIYRNDYAFSIAIHIMNGFNKGDFAKELPGKLYYTTDKDILQKHKDTKMTFLVGKEDYPGDYLLIKTEDINVHVMNKLSLQRVIDGVEDNG